MAITNGNDVNVETNEDVAVATKGNNSGMVDFFTISQETSVDSTSYDAEIKAFIDGAKKAAEKTNVKIDLIHLDKEAFGFDYSFLAVAAVFDDCIYYGLIEFAKTGRTYLTPTEYLNTLELNAKGTVEPIVIPGVSINEPVQIATIKNLMAKYPSVPQDEIVDVGGVVVYENVDLTNEDIAAAITGKVISDLIIVKYESEALYSGKVFIETGLKLNSENPSGLKFRELPMTEDSVAINGSVRTTNYTVETSIQSKRKALIPNDHSGSKKIGAARGAVSPVIFEDIDERTGQPILNFAPEICVNIIDSAPPSTDQAIVELFAATLVARDRRWVKPLLADQSRPGKNIGVLDRIYKDSKGNRLPEAKLGNKSKDELVKEILKRVKDMPVICLDVPVFDINNQAVDTFRIAAGNPNDIATKLARKSLITACHDVTNGKFPVDFLEKADLFSTKAVKLPFGTFTGKNGEEISLDYIDERYILSLKATSAKEEDYYEKLLWEYAASCTGEITDTLTARLNLLEELDRALNLNIKIKGIKYRLYFSDEFLETLNDAFNLSGIAFSVDSDGVEAMVDRSFGFMRNLLNKSGLKLPSIGGAYASSRPTRTFHR